MHHIIQAGGLGPPAFSAVPFWIGFWIATAVILLVVALVGSVIMLVNRVEWQAANTVMALSDVQEATKPLTVLPAANAHLSAIVRALLGIVAAKKAGGGS
ncbi:MAG: hypothetical protein FWE35_26615 [Streptosporangiales bacterium]|nr:hypothetical protein [Streptosporangiales bacterium]